MGQTPLLGQMSLAGHRGILQQAEHALKEVIADVSNCASVMKLTPRMPKAMIKAIRAVNNPETKENRANRTIFKS